MMPRCFAWLIAVLMVAQVIPFGRGAEAADGLREFQAENGVLALTLRAVKRTVLVAGATIETMTFDGDDAGPVLRVHPNDLLSIRLINDLDQPTNLHFHGMRSSPIGGGDNVHLSIPPGQSFTYRIRIPAGQPPGLYWFHAHPHGLSRQQVEDGLSGTIVVEGIKPAGMSDRILVLKDRAFDDETGSETIDDDWHGLIQTVNGRPDFDAAMQPGETQLWRISNQSADRYFHIALAGHRFRIIAEDGDPVIDERWTNVVDIAPARRFEVLVQGGTPGSYEIISKGAMTGHGANRRPDRVLGHLTVDGATVAPVAWPQPLLPPDLRQMAISASRTVTFSQTSARRPEDQRFFINGRRFDADRVDTRVPLGSIEEWTIRNDTDDMHVFHIHQTSFQVVEVNGKPVPYTGEIDTVRVPERGEVKLRIPFTDPAMVGRFMYHCHVLRHEDGGMMAQIEVYDPSRLRIAEQLRLITLHVWWWLNGVPWSQCGLASV